MTTPEFDTDIFLPSNLPLLREELETVMNKVAKKYGIVIKLMNCVERSDEDVVFKVKMSKRFTVVKENNKFYVRDNGFGIRFDDEWTEQDAYAHADFLNEEVRKRGNDE